MGAWAVGPFSNDDAADFVDDLAELKSRKVEAKLMRALRLAPDEYIELPEACKAIAAAALVAMKLGYMPPEDHGLEVEGEFEVSPQLRSASTAAVRRVRSDESEWVEVWAEAGSLEEAKGVLADIEQQLS